MMKARSKLLALAILTAAYFLGGKLGLSLAFANTNATPVWPPAGIALAGVLLLGAWVWPAILIAAFFVNYTTGTTPVPMAFAIAVGNTLEAVLGGLLVKEYAGGVNAFDRPQNIFKFVGFAGILSTAVSATVGATIVAVQLPPRWEFYGSIWLTWWLGDMVSILTIAPMLLIWATRPKKILRTSQVAELWTIAFLVIVLGFTIFDGWLPQHLRNYPLEYLIMPVLLWAAFRFGQRAAVTGAILMAIIALRGTLRGFGPFAVHHHNESLLLLQAFVGIVTVTMLVLAAALSDRKRSEEGMKESENRLRAIIDNSTAIIILKDVHGRYLMVNRQWESVMAKSASEVIGKTGLDIYERTIAEKMMKDDRRVFDSGQSIQFEESLPRPDGWHTYITIKFPLIDADGSTYALCAIATDISDRTKAENERKQLLDSERAARADAERANRSKDEFLATVSHELRTPLNAILGWAQLLTTGKSTDEDLAYGLETIERNAAAQAQLVEDLLDMSRIISGKMRLSLSRVDLPALVAAACNSVTPLVEGKNLHLTCSVDPCPQVMGDALRLQQVVLNLLNNAVKFTPEAGRIHTSLKAHGDEHVRLTVTDTGRGIKPEFLPHIFERFRQAESATTRSHGGVGLGLSIVKHLVDLHGGTIEAHSEGEGRGATFVVELPAAPAQMGIKAPPREAGSVAAGSPPAAVSLEGVKILVVDDEADARDLVKRILHESRATICTAGSAGEAMELIHKERPDLLLSDIGMPIEDGYMLLSRVRALPPGGGGDMVAIALTAFARVEDRDRALRAGFAAHISKPINASSLIATIASVVRSAPSATVTK